MAEVSLDRYRFETTSSGAVQVYGPGLPQWGARLAEDTASLSPSSFLNLASNPNYEVVAQYAMKQFGSSPVAANEIKTALSGPVPAPAAPPPTPDAQTSQQNKAYVDGGGANDDKTKPPTPGNQPTSSAAIPEMVVTASKVGKRQKNPLGSFSSYAYQLTLYMITPDAYDMFLQSGRKNINAFTSSGTGAPTSSKIGGGTYVVARSGGINSKSTRAPGFNLDYYIDDLKITTATAAPSSGGESNITDITFTITEPYGFSFLSNMKKASDAIMEYSKLRGYEQLDNASRQFFMLGIRFQGYDKDGKPAAGDTIVGANGAGENGVFERFYEINMNSVKFKLDGKATMYYITASSLGQSKGLGIVRGRINNGAMAVAKTVKEALIGDDPTNGAIGILTQINKNEQNYVNNKDVEIANRYKVVFLGDAEREIGNASIVNKAADPDKSKWPMAAVKSVEDLNENLAVKSTPDNNRRTVTFKNDTPISQAISLLVSQSSYLESAVTSIYTTATEPNDQTNSQDEVKPASKKTFKWFNVSSEVKALGWDTKRNDFAYDITYVIQTYDTPMVRSSVIDNTTPYYGAVKRYEYWFTGQNSEIISYEQVLDNTFFTIMVGDSENSSAHTAPGQVPLIIGKHPNAPRQGKPGQGADAQNSAVTSLNDPGNLASAKITILGDPDFLIQDSTSSVNAVYDKYYGPDGYTISANGGQVFIEIDFKEGIDYNNTTGLMDINSNILFWEYPPESKISGISYQVIKVISTFSKGKFTQVLECKINDFASDTPNTGKPSGLDPSGRKTAATDERVKNNPTGNDTTTPTGGSANGLKPEPPLTTSKNVSPPEPSGDSSGTQRTSPTGGNSSPPATPQPPAEKPTPFPTVGETTKFAGATLTTSAEYNTVGLIQLAVVLPSGKELANVAGWTDSQWDYQISVANPADLDSLRKLKESNNTVLLSMIKTAREKSRANEKVAVENQDVKDAFYNNQVSSGNIIVSKAVQDGESTGDGNVKSGSGDEGGRED